MPFFRRSNPVNIRIHLISLNHVVARHRTVGFLRSKMIGKGKYLYRFPTELDVGVHRQKLICGATTLQKHIFFDVFSR